MKKNNYFIILIVYSFLVIFILSSYAYLFSSEIKHLKIKEVKITRNYKIIKATITAYSSTVDQTDSTPFITASGKRVGDGIIACPAYLKFGTSVEIENKKYTCFDRMGLRYRHGNYFDIWMNSRHEALEFGRQSLKIRIYE